MTDREPLPGSEEVMAGVDSGLLDLAKFEGKAGQVLTLPHEHRGRAASDRGR